MFELLVGVCVEDPDRDAPNRGAPAQACLLDKEVLLPNIAAGMEKPADFSTVGIDARKVGTFVQVAIWTGEGQVLLGSHPTMLAWNDVFDMEDEHAAL